MNQIGQEIAKENMENWQFCWVERNSWACYDISRKKYNDDIYIELAVYSFISSSNYSSALLK